MMDDKEFNDLKYNEVLKQKEHEYNNPELGIYFIFDKKTQELMYVGRNKEQKNVRDFRIRVWYQMMRANKNTLGKNMKKIDEDKRGWNRAQLMEYIRNNFSFRYLAINDSKELKEFERGCIKEKQPRYNIEYNPRYKGIHC